MELDGGVDIGGGGGGDSSMGMLSTIGTVAGSMFGMPWIGSALGALGGIFGSKSSSAGAAMANQMQIQEAQKNRDWQEKMSGSAYQRAVADMQLAGLNPMLAYSQGGASTPSGGAASGFQNEKLVGLTTATQLAQAGAQIMNMNADTEKKKAETFRTEVETPDLMAPDNKWNYGSQRANEELRNMTQQRQLLYRDVEKRIEDSKLSRIEQDRVANEVVNVLAQTKHLDAQAALARVNAVLRRYEVSEAKAYSKFYEGFGENKPYIDMGLGTASAVRRALGR